MAGIPKFDRGEVLLRAAQLFAERGYEGTSISQLVTATGLLRGSLYGAFGSKAELFRLAFDAASTGEDVDLVLDLLTVALRERACHDQGAAELVRAAIGSLESSGQDVGDRIFRRLIDRAGIERDIHQHRKIYNTTKEKE